MFSLAELLIVVLYMLKTLVILAGASAGLLLGSRFAVLMVRSSPRKAMRNRR
jgi:hypothetical protein